MINLLPSLLRSDAHDSDLGFSAQDDSAPDRRSWLWHLPGASLFSGFVRLKSWSARFQRGAYELTDLNQGIEEKFLGVAATLQSQSDLCVALVKESEDLLRQTAGDEAHPPAPSAAVAFIRTALGAIEGAGRQAEEVAAELAWCSEQMAVLENRQGWLERTIAPLCIIETLFRIQTAQLPAELRGTFESLTLEIGQLDKRMRGTFGQQSEALRTIRDAIGLACGHLSHQRERLARAVGEQSAAIRSSITDQERALDTIREQHLRLREKMRVIERDSADVIVGLQYQDITRQKLEHVIASLGDLELLTATPHAGGHRAAGDIAAQTARLELHQLEGIEIELDQATTAISSGTQRLLESLNGARKTGGDAELLTASAEALSLVTSQTLALLLDSEGVGEAAVQPMRAFGNLADNVTQATGDLAWSIRLIALNAQVQASRLESCSSLGILARETYLLSDETTRLTKEIERDVTEIIPRLKKLQSRCETLRGEYQAQKTAAADCGRKLPDLLAHYRDEARHALTRLDALLDKSHGVSTTLLTEADFTALSKSRFESVRTHLEAFARAYGEVSEERRSVAARAVAARGHRYTCESERRIQAAVLGVGAIATGSAALVAEAPKAFAAASDPNEALGLSVAEGTASATSDHSMSSADNIELF